MAEKQEAYTVSQAMSIVKGGLEKIRISVVGEVSEISDKPGYKAAYFTIRDKSAAMSCLMWRNKYAASGIVLKQGMLVELTGYFTCYAARGTMQFSVDKLQLAGEGMLRMQVAALARKLQAQGLMDESRKRKIPALPQRIALVTSPRGKAVHDVLRTLRKRYPLGEVFLYGVTVEGETAPQEMSEALQAACKAQPAYDVILLVRGGGSYESLMPFNDEGLARVIAACSIPVVTGIGHEPDNTIADMVADKRCSTPTAAAAAVVPSAEELEEKLKNAASLLSNAYVHRLEALNYRLERLSDRAIFKDENYLLAGYIQTLDMLEEQLKRALPNALLEDLQRIAILEQRLKLAIPNALNSDKQKLEQLSLRLSASMPQILSKQQQSLQMLKSKLQYCAPHILDSHSQHLQNLRTSLQQLIVERMNEASSSISLSAAKLEALSPIKTLARGYSITYSEDKNKVIDSVNDASCGQHVTVQLQDGQLGCSVVSIERQEI